MLGAARLCPLGELGKQRLGDALSPPLRAYVDDVHVREPVREDLPECEADCLPAVLGQEH